MPQARPACYTRARSDLERDALAHPAFVHLPAFVVLDHVSSGLVEANRSLPIGAPEVEFRATVFSHIAALCGVHCCLCNEVRNARHCFGTSLPFCKWLCGDFDGTCLGNLRTYPLCTGCTSQVIHHAVARHGRAVVGYAPHLKPVLDEDQFPDVLCAIFADRAFRQRVANNADTFAALRFDPRLKRHRARRYGVAA